MKVMWAGVAAWRERLRAGVVVTESDVMTKSVVTKFGEKHREWIAPHAALGVILKRPTFLPAPRPAIPVPPKAVALDRGAPHELVWQSSSGRG